MLKKKKKVLPWGCAKRATEFSDLGPLLSCREEKCGGMDLCKMASGSGGGGVPNPENNFSSPLSSKWTTEVSLSHSQETSGCIQAKGR